MLARFHRVSPKKPCLVCGGDHKCSFTAEGLLLCGRLSGEQTGFKLLGPAKNPTWTMYRLESGPEPGANRETKTTPATPPPVPQDFTLQAVYLQKKLTPLRRAELAVQLGLPIEALHGVPLIGWEDETQAYTFPEHDATGEVIGISTRKTDGTKRCLSGSRRGLTVTAGWIDRPGPIFLVEGASDSLALSLLGLAVLGRPSSHAGAGMLALMLQNVDPKRPIFVMGENDRKPDGRWPGKEGAETIARELQAHLNGRTVLCACPPDGFKDARDWVRSLLGDRPWATRNAKEREADTERFATIGRDLAHTFSQMAKEVQALPTGIARRWPAPVCITDLVAEIDNDSHPTGWIWDGFLPRNALVILSALPKCGKTTLLTHLLSSLNTGGEFLGRTVLPSRAVVLTEEDKSVWAERQKRLGLTGNIALTIRPFLGRPTHEDWLSYLNSLQADLEADSRDLVILDTLADLWPVRDENHATDVTDALKPLRRLATNGRTVLCIHHVRKSGGDHGTASRGSGAIAGFFDVMMEMGYATGDPDGRRRRLLAKGRREGIPPETLIELAKDALHYELVDAGEATVSRVRQREVNEEDRRVSLRESLCLRIPFDEEKAVTREELWNGLPEQLRVNVKRFEAVLEEHVGTLWERKGGVGRGGIRYWRVRKWTGHECVD
jgi:hypothetical protein